MMENKGFKKRLKHYREKAGLSQRALSRKLGMKSESSCCQWEQGVCDPPVKKLPELAAALGISLRLLFDPDVPPPLEPKSIDEIDEGWGDEDEDEGGGL